MKKRIGILTSGGDCPGLNAALRGIVTHGVDTYGWDIIGIRRGTMGLIERPLSIESRDFQDDYLDLLIKGGTLLEGFSKDNSSFLSKKKPSSASVQLMEGYNQLGLDALVCIGGDGSLKILHHLSKEQPFNFVAIPKTIDNDIVGTDLSIGFSTALEIVIDALDRLRTTARSHQRIIVLEVMGRDAGHIALQGGIGGGADVILLPEVPYAFDNLCKKVKSCWERNKNYCLVVVTESVKKEDGFSEVVEESIKGRVRYGGIAHYLSARLEESLEIEARPIVLGHIQRGGIPNATDRILATAFGVKAVDLIEEGSFGQMVAWKAGRVSSVAVEEIVNKQNVIVKDNPLLKLATKMGIYVGEVWKN